MKYSKRTKRFISTILSVFVLLHTLPIPALAQSWLSEDERDAYVSEVSSRAALYEDLEQKRKQAVYRRETIEKSIANLESQSPPAGTDSTDWYRQRDEQIDWLNDYLKRNEDNLAKYESNLSTVKTNLESDRKYIMTSDDPELKQSLGTLIGVAGIAGIPISSRPTMGSLKASVGRTMMGQRLNSTTKAISKAQVKSSALQTQAASLKAPTKGSWNTIVTSNGELALQNGSQIKKLGVKAQVKAADGSMIKNDAGYKKADYYKEIYTSKSSISHRIDTLKYERSVAKNTKAQKAIDSRIKELEAKQAKLQEDVAKHDSENKSTKSTMKNLAASAAKWAAFSVAMTLTTRTFEQLKANDWKFSAIDWGYVVDPLKTADFWGGTGGSFVGSMLFTAIVPGGAFVKTLAAIGGAAIGWQLGSGNLMETDWMELGATSLGATIGATLGMALGPIGSFLGGMAGHYLSKWLLDKIREKLHPGYTGFDRTNATQYKVDPTKAYADGTNLYRQPDFGDDEAEDFGEYSNEDLATLHARMLQLQTEMSSVMTSGNSYDSQQKLYNLRAEYDTIQQKIYDARERNSGNF